jgi:peptidoglycan/LPS O-acetylase OafA/YrhL
MTKDRFLLIDVLRIVGIGFVLLEHASTSSFYPWLFEHYLNVNLWDMVHISYGSIGVWIFIFASGLSLACSHLNIDSFGKLKVFYGKRVLRIYPTYWTAILFTIIAEPYILQRNFTLTDITKLVTGFQALGAHTEMEVLGKVNGPFWFLTVMLSLYLLYPILAFAIRKHPHVSLLSLLVIQELSIYYMQYHTSYFGGYNWFPPCRVFDFGLGIYLIKIGLYPKMMNRSSLIIYLSNIVFYVYLINEPIFFNLAQYPILLAASLLIVSTMMYKFDQAVKSAISSWFK